jgi:hypothetical protein
MFSHNLLLIAASIFAGIVNSVAGGGSFVVFPLLIASGIPAVTANATNSFIVQPGALASAFGYRRPLKKLPKKYFLLLIPGAIGGLVGAIILRHTPNNVFGKIVPFFILSAVLLLSAQPIIHRWAVSKSRRRHHKKHPALVFTSLIIAFLLLSIYGGYFGAGYGIMALGILGITELKDIHQMNGIKNLVSVALGFSSIFYYITHHLIRWEVLPLLVIGNIIGGYFGSVYASKLPNNVIRLTAIGIGSVITVILFRKYY